MTEAKVGILVQGTDDVIPIIIYGFETKPSEVHEAFCNPSSPRVIRMSAEEFTLAFVKASGVDPLEIARAIFKQSGVQAP